MGWETAGHFFGVMVDVEEDLPSTCALRSIFGKSENARSAQGNNILVHTISIISCDMKF